MDAIADVIAILFEVQHRSFEGLESDKKLSLRPDLFSVFLLIPDHLFCVKLVYLLVEVGAGEGLKRGLWL